MVVALLFHTDQTVIVGVVVVILVGAPQCVFSDRLTIGCCTCRQTHEATLEAQISIRLSASCSAVVLKHCNA